MDLTSFGLLIGGAAFGVLAALAGSATQRRRQAQTLPNVSSILQQALEGVWVEHVPDAPGRSISVGHIYFDRKNGRLAFDGTNYNDNLRPFCYWKTFASACLEQEGKFNYTFQAILEGSLNKIYYGNGMIFFSRVGDQITVDNGFYVSIDVDPSQKSHSMKRAAVLQHPHAYQKVYSPEQLATILRNAGIPLPLGSVVFVQEPASCENSAAD